MGILGIVGILGVKPQYTAFTQYPQSTRNPKKAQSEGLLCVTISYYEHSDIIDKNIVTHCNPS